MEDFMHQRFLRIGIIGAGFNAQFHIRSFVNVRNCLITGFVSRSQESVDKCIHLVKKLYLGNPIHYESVEAMAASDNIDAIWINAPNNHRVAILEKIVKGNAKRASKLLGIACEKPLARNVKEALLMLQLVTEAGIPTGYLENQVFAPTVTKGKELIWARAAKVTGRPYLVRAAEEHSGPHAPWFWQGSLQGGGVLNDMMCHSVEAARFLLTDPTKPRNSLKPVKVQATIASLKWSKDKYAKELKQLSHDIDYKKHPSEDYAHATITFKDEEDNTLIAELTTSWSYVGAGLRLSFEMLGPEYSMKANTLSSGLDVFLSRRIQSDQGEDLVEKQNAEQGLMPVVPDEEAVYGYTAENRHMVESFLFGQKPLLTFEDGVEVVKLLMACYYSAQEERTMNFDKIEEELADFIPDVAKGTWRPFVNNE